MFNKLFNSVIVPISILFPILAGVTKWKNLNGCSKILFWYLVFTALINTVSTYTARKLHLNNMPIVHIYTIIEVAVFSWFYKALIGVNQKKATFLVIILSFTLASVVNAFFFQSIYTYNSYTRSIEAIICMLFSLQYFAKLAATSEYKATVLIPEFYFSVGIFLYFSGAFILFVFSNFIVSISSKSDFIGIWNIHAMLVLIQYIFFTIGFFLCKK